MAVNSGRNVVVTGRSVVSPLGDDLGSTLNACYEGKSSFQPLLEYGENQQSIYAGRCADLDLSILPDKKVQKSIVRRDLIGLIAALRAADEALISKGSVNSERFGIYIGASSTQIRDLEPYYSLVRKSFQDSSFDSEAFGRDLLGNVNPLVMLHTLMNNTLCYASIALDIRGVNGNFMDFQSAGANAMIEGFYAVQEGRADVVLTGGVSGSPESYQMKQGIDSGYLAFEGSDVNSDGIIRPYSDNRCGTILSEGASFIVLEEEEHARRRGAVPMARLVGVAKGSDADFAFLNHKKSKGLVNCLKNLKKQDRFEEEKLGLIMGHGNGSIHGDMVEFGAYREVFEGWKDLLLASPKANFGEMSEASSVASAVLVSEILNGADLFPVHNFNDHMQGEITVNTSRQTYRKEQVVVTSRSFSGLCCALILERY